MTLDLTGHALPCEGCGTDVVFWTGPDELEPVPAWAQGKVVLWCTECWAKKTCSYCHQHISRCECER